MQMKKRISSLLLALCLTAGLIPLSVQTAAAAKQGTEQKAWYPAARMYIVQIAYESGGDASHKDRNTFDIANTTDIKDKTEKRIFAPFTGIIVFKEKEYNFVLLQSKEKVRYADGTLDYMTVGFMHDNDIDDLKLGQEIKQGDPFYDVGRRNKGKDDPNMGKHVQITVYKGQLYNVNSREKDGSYTKLHDLGKNWYSKGTVDPYNAFFVNTNKTKTTQYTEVGHLAKGHTVSKKGALSDWSGQWKDLNGDPFPALPTISGVKAPSTLKAGKSFSVQGKVSSKTRLLSVTAGVYDAETGGTMLTGGTVDPSQPYRTATRKISYKITGSALANLVKFNQLPAGTYWYRVTAKNGGGTATLVNQPFTVHGTQTKPTKPTQTTQPTQTTKPTQTQPEKTTVYISNANYPETLKVGEAFSIKGTVSATARINYVIAAVYTTEQGGSVQLERTLYNRGSSKSYDLANFTTNEVRFQNLPAGTYWYRVTVGVDAGEAIMLNQKFTVSEPYVAPAPTSTAKVVYPADGWYTFSPACAPGMMLDVAYSGVCSEDPVWIWPANGSSAQLWHIIPYGRDGSNILWAGVDPDTRMVLDVQSGGITSGTPVWQYEFNGSPAQQWIFLDAGGGYYYIVPSENQSLALAVRGGSSAEGSSLVVETRNNSLGQKWKLTRYGS